MTPRKRKATESAEGASPPKRTAKSRAAKKQDDPVWATENANSHLVNQDLHAEYCDPKTYQGWTQKDWEEIHDCLPENVPFNEDGYSVPIIYFRYDPDWRRLVREFQEDLGAGRYEPQWQEEAARAMEKRAAGKFDKYKEDQYEAFWGQKQKLRVEDRAGESAKIKLSDLVEAGRIRLGDDLSFRRAFEKKGEGAEGKWMIEKDMKVVAINGSSLTVIIPPGQTKYPKIQHSASPIQPKSTENDDEGRVALSYDPKANGAKFVEGTHQNISDRLNILDYPNGNSNGMSDFTHTNESRKHSTPGSLNSHRRSLSSTSDTVTLESRQSNSLAPEGMAQVEGISNGLTESKPSHKFEIESIMKSHSPPEDMDASVKGGENPVVGTAKANETVENDLGSTSSKDTNPIDPETGCILHQVKTIKSFSDKIIEIDGRLNPKDAPILSNWRLIRLQRNNQDLGSLFDLREEFYVWKSPDIVKMPKKGREVGRVQMKSGDSAGNGKQTQEKDKASPKKRTSRRASKSTERAREEETRALEDEEVTESIESAGAERGDESDFDMRTSRDKKLKARARTKKSTGRLQASSHRIDKSGQGGEENEGEEEVPKQATQKPYLCPHCQNGFTTKRARKQHIKVSCKGISKG